MEILSEINIIYYTARVYNHVASRRSDDARTRREDLPLHHRRSYRLCCSDGRREHVGDDRWRHAVRQNEVHVLAGALQHFDVALLVADEHELLVFEQCPRLGGQFAVHLDECLPGRCSLQRRLSGLDKHFKFHRAEAERHQGEKNPDEKVGQPVERESRGGDM